MSKPSVAILTTFMDFNPGYSLSGIVVDQAFMLLREGHKVAIFVSEQYNPKYDDDARISALKKDFPDTFEMVYKTKFMHLIDYESLTDLSEEHQKQAEEAGGIFSSEILSRNIRVIYTHDFIFTGWNLPFSEAIKWAQLNLSGQKYYVNWYHWIHSVPYGNKDWWDITSYGPNHQIVFPNRTTIMQVAENFRGQASRVRIIPHIKDIRTWYDFSKETMDFIDAHPCIVESDIVQIYPCSSDRLDAKQLDVVIRIFGELKKMNMSVCLVAANQWATGRQPIQNVAKYIQLAVSCGLDYGKDFLFTSELLSNPKMAERIFECQSYDDMAEVISEMKVKGEVPEYWSPQGDDIYDDMDILCEFIRPYAKGINRRMLRELQLCGSLFIFPTREESFGLVGPESAFSGCLNVNNRSLTMMYEVMGHMAPSFDFGSHHINHPHTREDEYIHTVSVAILQRILMNESVMTKILCRTRYNMNNMYIRYYQPLTLVS
jgi:hypothetical protein